MFEFTANLHVHTTCSDGSGSPPEVIQAAKHAGLDVLLLNDHDTLAAKEAGFEGYHGRLLVLVGAELSGRHNHYLAYGLSWCPKYECLRPQPAIDQVRAQGGCGFLAHPFELGSPLSEGGRAFTWTDWSVTGFDGLCIWNHASIWKTRARSLIPGLWHYLFKTWTLLGPDQQVLAKWDELGRSRRVAGIGGSDAHAFEFKLFGRFQVKVLPYEVAFRAINTHLLLPSPLTGNLEADRKLVLTALAAGSCFVAHDRLGSARGFDFRLENQDQIRAGQGEEVPRVKGDVLVYRLPARALVRLRLDGGLVQEVIADQGRLAVDGPGVYRLEAYRLTRLFGPRPWIFSNPIYIR